MRKRWLVMTAMSAMAGVLALASFFAPATVRFATLSSSDVPAVGGPLVLASESPRELVLEVASLRGVDDDGTVLSTSPAPEGEGALTVKAVQGGGALVSSPAAVGEQNVMLEVPGAPFTVTYVASGATASVTVSTAAGTLSAQGVPVEMTGVYTPSDADVTWELQTFPSGSTPTVIAMVLWAAAATLIAGVLALAVLGLPSRRPRVALDARWAALAGLVWLGLALLHRAHFDDGWILAQARLYEGYGWFSMYWENAALPAPTGYLWEWAFRLLAELSDYQYALTRVLSSAIVWFLAWYLVDRALRYQGATGTSRLIAFAVVAAVGGGIGMNVRPESFTAMLAAGILLLATRAPARFSSTGIVAAVLTGLAIGSHPAGWVVALPAAAVVIRDAAAMTEWGSRALLLIGSAAAAGATLATVVSVDSSGAVALPAIEYLSAGPLQGKNPLDELARVNDVAGMSPNFRMGLAMVLLALALSLGWLLRSGSSKNSFLIVCSVLSISGLALTTSKWAAHTAAVAPATAVAIALSWPLVARTTVRGVAAIFGLVLVAVWSFRGDVNLGWEYLGHGSSLPGDQLFTSAATAWTAALLWLGLAALLGGVLLALPISRAVTAGIAASFVVLVPSLAITTTSAIEVIRAQDEWSLTTQHLKPTSDCGAAEEMPVFFDEDGTLADPTALPVQEVTKDASRSITVPPDAQEVAVWVTSTAGPSVRVRIVGESGAVDLERHEPDGADFAMWTGRLDSVSAGQLRLVNPRGESLAWSAPQFGRIAMWGNNASGKQVLQAPYTILQIPCTRPLPLPLDTLTDNALLVWTGDVFQSPDWWLPVRLARSNPVYSVSAAAGPVGLNTSVMAPTELGREMRPAKCVTGWLSTAVAGCTPEAVG